MKAISGLLHMLVWVALACPGIAHAETTPVVFTGEQVMVHKKLEVLPDPGGKLQIGDVSSPAFTGHFQPAPSFQGKVAQSNVYWLRVAIDNPQAIEKTAAISFRAASWNEVLIFSEAEGFKMRRSGVQVPIPERDIEMTMRARGDPYYAVRAMLPPSATTTFYLRVTSDWRYGEPWVIALEINELNALREEERRLRPIVALFFGILVALALYHLMLFIGLRDSSFGYYVIHIAGLAMIAPAFCGLTAEYLWPGHPGWELDAIVVWKTMVTFGLLQFARVFLDTRKNHRWLDLALRLWVAGCVFVLVFAPFGNYRSNNEVSGLLLITAYVLAFTVGIVSVVKRNPLARYFLAANVFTFVGLAVAVVGEQGLLPGVPLADFAPQFGTTIEALLLSRGLSYRISLIKAQLAEQRLAEERLRREQEEEKRAFLEEQKTALEHKVAERTAELSAERERSEVLVRNILPASIAEELKRDGQSAPRRHEEVSILFTDFAGFTQTMATIPPQRMVGELNEIFHGFDEIVERHGLEKIKTIGDAYLAAAGLPEAMVGHAEKCVLAALDMQKWIANRNASASIKWDLRIGVHSGPVVAGVVGRKKYAYDIWGDTVNTASRMESAGAVGRVNVSAYTYDLIRDQFDCEYRGKVVAKGKGEIDMYFVLARRV